jgi:SNF2 family DNA or RNA helicase
MKYMCCASDQVPEISISLSFNFQIIYVAIQFDVLICARYCTTGCTGKLVELDRLLAHLSMQSWRVIVMTGMTSMLDVLEAYMDSKRRNHLRLDPSVEVLDMNIISMCDVC